MSFPYENQIIGSFIYFLGFAAGRRGEVRSAILNLIQQTPLDPTFGDFVGGFDRCVAINLKSCVLAAKHVLPIMRAQNSGAIINISSMAAITTYPYVAYKATKSAMIAFTSASGTLRSTSRSEI